MRTLFFIFGGYWRIPVVRRGLMALVLLLATLYLINSYAYRPAQIRFQALKAQAVSLQSELADLEIRSDLVVQFAALTAQTADVQRRFEADVDRSGIVERMARMSANAGTRIIHGSNNFGQARQGVVPVLQDLTLEGSYGQIREFISQLSGIETLTILRAIEMTSNPDGTLVRAKIKLITFAQGSG